MICYFCKKIIMKKIFLLLVSLIFTNTSSAQTTIYKETINDIDGNKINFNDYKGKYLLFVNVASYCGFTNQYKELEILSKKYSDKLAVFGVPCNQFGNQEPGNANEIKQFCEAKYDISFVLTEKIDVKGKKQHSLYSWLTNKNGVKKSSVKWNFQKYLVSDEGKLVDYFYSTTSPLSDKITSYLD